MAEAFVVLSKGARDGSSRPCAEPHSIATSEELETSSNGRMNWRMKDGLV